MALAMSTRSHVHLLNQTLTAGSGLRAVLTRPVDRQRDLEAHLKSTGWDVLCVPALELVPVDQPALSELEHPHGFDCVIFVSRTAWQVYTASLGGFWPAQTWIAVVGQGTAGIIRKDFESGRLRCSGPDKAPENPSDRQAGTESELTWAGQSVLRCKVDLPELMTPHLSDTQDSEGLWRALQSRLAPNAQVLIVAGRHGRSWLADTLRKHGVDCRVLEVYQRHPAPISEDAANTLKAWSSAGLAGAAGVWLFTSLHGLAAHRKSLARAGLLSVISPQAVVVTHPRLVQPARDWLAQTDAAAQAPVWTCNPDGAGIKDAFDQARLAIGY